MVQLVLNSLPIYYFSLVKAPKSIIKSMENISRDFIWSGVLTNLEVTWGFCNPFQLERSFLILLMGFPPSCNFMLSMKLFPKKKKYKLGSNIVRWEWTSLPTGNGGLGVGSLLHCNISLMTKGCGDLIKKNCCYGDKLLLVFIGSLLSCGKLEN